MLTKLHVHAIISKGVQCDQHHTPSDRNQTYLGSTAALSLIAPLRNCKAELMNEKNWIRAARLTASEITSGLARQIQLVSARTGQDHAKSLVLQLIAAVLNDRYMQYVESLPTEDKIIIFKAAITGIVAADIQAMSSVDDPRGNEDIGGN